jgi:hypothetical protein
LRLALNDNVFVGNQIIDESTDAGRLVSVVTARVPDLHTKRLSVFIPLVNIEATGETAPVTTVAVFSTEQTTIKGPAGVKGQVMNTKWCI